MLLLGRDTRSLIVSLCARHAAPINSWSWAVHGPTRRGLLLPKHGERAGQKKNACCPDGMLFSLTLAVVGPWHFTSCVESPPPPRFVFFLAKSGRLSSPVIAFPALFPRLLSCYPWPGGRRARAAAHRAVPDRVPVCVQSDDACRSQGWRVTLRRAVAGRRGLRARMDGDDQHTTYCCSAVWLCRVL